MLLGHVSLFLMTPRKLEPTKPLKQVLWHPSHSLPRFSFIDLDIGRINLYDWDFSKNEIRLSAQSQDSAAISVSKLLLLIVSADLSIFSVKVR